MLPAPRCRQCGLRQKDHFVFRDRLQSNQVSVIIGKLNKTKLSAFLSVTNARLVAKNSFVRFARIRHTHRAETPFCGALCPFLPLRCAGGNKANKSCLLVIQMRHAVCTGRVRLVDHTGQPTTSRHNETIDNKVATMEVCKYRPLAGSNQIRLTMRCPAAATNAIR